MIMERVKEAEAGFRSLMEATDTTTVSWTMIMQLIAVFAQLNDQYSRQEQRLDWMLLASGAALGTAAEAKA